MFRRRIFIARRPFLRRPRLLLGALVAGVGYAAGRSRTRGEAQVPATDEAGLSKLHELAELHAQGKLTDEEFSAAKRRLLGL